MNAKTKPGSQPDGHVAAPVLKQHGISEAELRARVRGQVIAPGDELYDEARSVFYGGIDRKPAVIIRAGDVSDVSFTISLARQTGLELAVRSGGHSVAGHSVSHGGIVLDLSRLRALQIDADRRTAWAESGLTAGEYTTAAAAHGLATGFGDTGSVGIGGLTLGGGVGYLIRKYGLTIDDLLAADIVTANGELLHADAETHPDLFWAIRGGGGNFGVATRFKFLLHPVDMVLGGILILPATAEVITAFMAEAEAAPDELSAIANVMPAPPMPFLPPEQHGKLVIFAMMVYAGPLDTGERAIAPFRKIATPISDMIRPMHYPEIYPPEESGYHPTAIGHTMFVERVDRAAADTIIDNLKASDAPVRVAQLRALGGAMARVPVEATAFAHRQSRIMVNVAAFYNGPEDRAARQTWVEDFTAALYQGDPGAYVNFLGDEGEERLKAAYPGATWERLRAVKRRYDPGNLFRLNQNIQPGD
jgi:FAD/FMN-containing dehydrogenase